MDKIERAMIAKNLNEDQKIIFDLVCKLSENPETANQAALLMGVLTAMELPGLVEAMLEAIMPVLLATEIALDVIARGHTRNN